MAAASRLYPRLTLHGARGRRANVGERWGRVMKDETCHPVRRRDVMRRASVSSEVSTPPPPPLWRRKVVFVMHLPPPWLRAAQHAPCAVRPPHSVTRTRRKTLVPLPRRARSPSTSAPSAAPCDVRRGVLLLQRYHLRRCLLCCRRGGASRRGEREHHRRASCERCGFGRVLFFLAARVVPLKMHSRLSHPPVRVANLQ